MVIKVNPLAKLAEVYSWYRMVELLLRHPKVQLSSWMRVLKKGSLYKQLIIKLPDPLRSSLLRITLLTLKTVVRMLKFLILLEVMILRVLLGSSAEMVIDEDKT